jgi:hypothetical protein
MAINVGAEFDNERVNVEADLGVYIGNNGMSFLVKALLVDNRTEGKNRLLDDGPDGSNSLDLEVGLSFSLNLSINLSFGLDLELIDIDLGSDEATKDVSIGFDVDNNISAEVEFDLVAGLDNGFNGGLFVQINNGLDTIYAALLQHTNGGTVKRGGSGLGSGEEGKGQDGGDEGGDSHVERRVRVLKDRVGVRG